MDGELKANIQLMMADYKEMCSEREELLHSLADVSKQDISRL